MRTTWDGLPISQEPPFGATVVVYRNRGGTLEVLLLHRAHRGPDYAGDWAWTPPAGSRLPDEPIDQCARRELREETGLDLPLTFTECGTAEWPHYLASVPPDAAVVLDAEHDRFEWVLVDNAPARCLPELTRLPLEAIIQRICNPADPEVSCVFCSPRIEPWVLWEGVHYRIVADAFPRLAGHILLITRDHVLHHADAPDMWWPEFETATERMREFLLATCGVASFWENGIVGKEVPHAHLHGLPVNVPTPVEWVMERKLLAVTGWDEIRRYRESAGDYTFVSGERGRDRYLAIDRSLVLAAARQATIARTGGILDPATGGLQRGGAAQVEETRRLWTAWSATAPSAGFGPATDP
jgi:8-oxo-dGTP pyrophosphatase MutT (NUDIX family)/diadenosine tetraphosphate (Ap4A) HIT family hydrolase